MSKQRPNGRRAELAARRRAGECRTRASAAEETTAVELLVALRDNQRLLRELAYASRMPRSAAVPRNSASVISCPHDIVKLLGEEMSTLCQEQLRVVLLDTKNHVLGCNLIYQGTIHSISIRAAEVLRPAILMNAPAVIIVHNHPSGDPDPSAEDVQATEYLMAASDTMDIQVLDHVVIGKAGRYISMQECGVIRPSVYGDATAA